MHARHGSVVVGHLGQTFTPPGPKAPVLLHCVNKIKLRVLQASAIGVNAIIEQARRHERVARVASQGDHVHDHEYSAAALVC